MDNERGRPRAFHVMVRRLAHDARRIVPMKSAELLREEAITVSRHHADPIVAAGMTDVGLVPVRVAVHERHHEAAIAAAGCGEPQAIDVALSQQIVRRRLDVGKFLFAITLGNRLEKLLPEA